MACVVVSTIPQSRKVQLIQACSPSYSRGLASAWRDRPRTSGIRVAPRAARRDAVSLGIREAGQRQEPLAVRAEPQIIRFFEAEMQEGALAAQ